MQDMKSRLANIGYTLEDSLRLQGKTMDAYHKELHPLAERRLKGRLVLSELTVREAITASRKRCRLSSIAWLAMRRVKSPKRHSAMYSARKTGCVIIRQDVLTDKTLARLRDIVTGQVAAAPLPVVAADESSPAINAAESVVEVTEGAVFPEADTVIDTGKPEETVEQASKEPAKDDSKAK